MQERGSRRGNIQQRFPETSRLPVSFFPLLVEHGGNACHAETHEEQSSVCHQSLNQFEVRDDDHDGPLLGLVARQHIPQSAEGEGEEVCDEEHEGGADQSDGVVPQGLGGFKRERPNADRRQEPRREDREGEQNAVEGRVLGPFASNFVICSTCISDLHNVE